MTEALLPPGISLYTLTPERAVALWERLKGYDALWPDDTRGDVTRWVEFAVAPTTLFLEEAGGHAMFILSGIREGLKANAHAVFHDHKLRPRIALTRALILWAMFEFDLYRLEARIPAFSHALRRFLYNVGFRFEGRLRDDFWFHGHLEDALVLSMLRQEAGG